MVTLPTCKLQLISDCSYQSLFQEDNLVAVALLLFTEKPKITEVLLHVGFLCCEAEQ